MELGHRTAALQGGQTWASGDAAGATSGRRMVTAWPTAGLLGFGEVHPAQAWEAGDLG